ncbi:MAG: hypothetical protein JWL96_2511 [Sphingomonas bacterium]|nr:hypothetical protein [Sphingomonas bacterium]
MQTRLSVNCVRKTVGAVMGGALTMAGAVTLSASFSAGAWAHHSFAGYDKSRKVTVQGTVKQWQFTNPHSWLQIFAVENGRQVEYSIEGASVNTLVRRGWNRTTFKAGDKVTISMYPAVDGKKGGALLSATFADGKTISTGITPN